ncbi:hypothetical protein [Streptomyces sp. MMG1121]|uniref:hypothetical protein n=1 Tax=Streptomyces sp. MMG1121 TaxID=1415544 RepID=UPI000ABBA9DC|nr:hypothetical protein [Streptomyces sp. MMG1121]
MRSPVTLARLSADDPDGPHALLTAHGAETVNGPNVVPTGHNAAVRHSGGIVVE